MKKENRLHVKAQAAMLLFLFFLVSVVSRGAGKTSFTFLKGENAISYVVDWKGLTVAGFSPKDWVKVRQTEQPDYNAEYELENELKTRINDFISTANKQLSNVGLFLTSGKGRKYTLYISPKNIGRRGENNIECAIKETATGKVMAEFVVNGKGGMLGSMANMWGNGMKSAGKKFGKTVCKGLGYDPTMLDRIDKVLSKTGIE